MRSITISLLILIMALGFACKKEGDQESAKPAETGSALNSATPAAAIATDDLKITLLDAGSEPKQTLRYKFETGKKETMIMDMKVAMAMSMGTFKQPETKLPTIRTIMDVESKEILPDGDLKYEFKVTDTQVQEDEDASPMVVSAMKEEAERTKGLSGWAIVNDRGFTKKAEFNVPADASKQLRDMVDNMRQQIRSMSSPLPEEPVGKDAKWKSPSPSSRRRSK